MGHDGLLSPSVGDYFQLLKPRVMILVIFTSICGLMIAPGSLHPLMSLIAILSIATGAGGSGCLNMWYERDVDAKMTRTAKRPLPMKRIDADSALAFGMVLSLGSVLMMAVAVNYIAALLLAFTIFFYVVIYTMILKPHTAQNIVIGGAAGALPPVIGWAAVTGEVSLVPIFLFLIIFFWTVPHFWALALIKGEEYARAGIPMMPNVKGAFHTKCQMLVYAVLTFGSSLGPWWIGFSNLFYVATAIPLGLVFIILTLQLLLKPKGVEILLFSYSIAYLFLLFLALVIDNRISP
jgi:protoheme IX farnesyltransferase